MEQLRKAQCKRIQAARRSTKLIDYIVSQQKYISDYKGNYFSVTLISRNFPHAHQLPCKVQRYCKCYADTMISFNVWWGGRVDWLCPCRHKDIRLGRNKQSTQDRISGKSQDKENARKKWQLKGIHHTKAISFFICTLYMLWLWMSLVYPFGDHVTSTPTPIRRAFPW